MRANRIGSRGGALSHLSRFCGHAGRAASVGFMAPKPPSSVDQTQAAADDSAAPELDENLSAAQIAGGRIAGDKPAASPPDDDDDELEIEDDEDDEDLVVFTAKEAAGAL